jgi:hypothetical protein
VAFNAENLGGDGVACDVSMSGCTFRAETHQPKEGSVLSMRLQIAKDVEPIAVEAVVGNVRQDHVGVEFLRFQQAGKERLQHFIRFLLVRRAAQAHRSENHVAGAEAEADYRRDRLGEDAAGHHPVSVKS